MAYVSQTLPRNFRTGGLSIQRCARSELALHQHPVHSLDESIGRRIGSTVPDFYGGDDSDYGTESDSVHSSDTTTVPSVESSEEEEEQPFQDYRLNLSQKLEPLWEDVVPSRQNTSSVPWYERKRRYRSCPSVQAHMVSAFEQSLSNMTNRLQHLTATAEQKDSELYDLRQTIDALKRQSAQAGLTKMALQSIQAVQRSAPPGNLIRRHTFNTTKDSVLTEHRMSRQFSTESMSSDVEKSLDILEHCKKKKKKNWLRSSFSKAFSRSKKNKNGSVSDVEDLRQFQSDSSTPNSPLLGLSHHLNGGTTLSSQNLKLSQSSSALISRLYDKEEAICPELVQDLRHQLREKDMELTDIRLDALTSAHQMEGLKETINKMRTEIISLKQDNERLQRLVDQNNHHSSQDHDTGLSSSEPSGSPSTETFITEISLPDKEGKRITISVLLGCHGDSVKHSQENKVSEWMIGSTTVSSKTKWDLLDNLVKKTFKEFTLRVDPLSNLGLSGESIHSYQIGDLVRSKKSEMPELLPCGYLIGDNMHIQITLKGTTQNSIEALAFETLIPKSIVQRYISLLTEHRRIILCGPSGTGKTFMAHRLAEYLVLKSGRDVTAGSIATFSVDHKSAKELRQYLSTIAEQCENNKASELPTVIILDNLHHVGSLGEVFNGFLSSKYQKCPYIIGTMNQATCSTPNLQLHHNFRWVLCANHMEPVKGFLGRYLRRRLIEEEVSHNVSVELFRIFDWMPKVWQHLNKFLETHSSSDVTIGPRLFLPCPLDISNSQVWFTDLWNYSIIPYLLEAVREGLQLYGRRAPWEDPAEWVLESYPWPKSPSGEWPQLLRLRPEDVGYEGNIGPAPKTGGPPVNNDMESDPLLSMLMRLQEVATYSSPLGHDSDSSSHTSVLNDELSNSLESTI